MEFTVSSDLWFCLAFASRMAEKKTIMVYQFCVCWVTFHVFNKIWFLQALCLHSFLKVVDSTEHC